MDRTEITVVGMGYVGMTAALALAEHTQSVICVGDFRPPGTLKDTRSTALFPESVAMLKSLGVWQRIEHVSRPLLGIRVIDETDTLLKAPEITFRAGECGLDALALNVPNAALHDALADRMHNTGGLTLATGGPATDYKHEDQTVVVQLANGDAIETRVLVAADGQNSPARVASGITLRTWTYNQVAIACRFTHSAPHDDISTEFHHPAGPFTTVPGPSEDGQHSSHLVWIETPDEAQRLAKLDDQAFSNAMEKQLQGLLGHIKGVAARGLFPIKGQSARTFAASNTYLIGEAAHVMPPIGAQGMNLGFRDIAGLLEALKGARNQQEQMILYNRDRRDDVWMRTTAVDLLNRSLSTPYWPAKALRGAGLHILNTFPALKRATIQAGFGN